MDLAELLSLAVGQGLSDLFVGLPGRVESYSASASTADVRPMLRRPVDDPDGSALFEDLPVIPSVRVVWPGGGGFAISFPLAEGDTGVLLCLDYPIDGWGRNGALASPGDLRAHSLSSAVFIPGLRHNGNALAAASGSNVVIGSDTSANARIVITPSRTEIGGSSDAAALASRVKTLETALVNHIHPTPSGASSVSAQLQSPLYTPQTFDSDRLKLGG